MARGPSKRASGDKLDWYPWYVTDWQTDERARLLDAEAQGCYRALLDHQWMEGSIPADPEMIDALLPRHSKPIGSLWACLADLFESVNGDPTRLVNPKLEKIRAQQVGYIKHQRESGSRGGKASARQRVKRDAEGGKTRRSKPTSEPTSKPAQSIEGRVESREEPPNPPPRARGAAMKPFDVIWKAAYGGELFPKGSRTGGAAAKVLWSVLGSIATELSAGRDDEIVTAEAQRRFKAFCAETPKQFVNMTKFGQTHGSYRGDRAPAAEKAVTGAFAKRKR